MDNRAKMTHKDHKGVVARMALDRVAEHEAAGWVLVAEEPIVFQDAEEKKVVAEKKAPGRPRRRKVI